jgi:hypothetical protein
MVGHPNSFCSKSVFKICSAGGTVKTSKRRKTLVLHSILNHLNYYLSIGFKKKKIKQEQARMPAQVNI